MTTVTKEMCIAALDSAFHAGIGRLHAELAHAVVTRDSSAKWVFEKHLAKHLEVYQIALAAIDKVFAEPPTAMESAPPHPEPLSKDALHARPSPFKDYVPERKSP